MQSDVNGEKTSGKKIGFNYPMPYPIVQYLKLDIFF